MSQDLTKKILSVLTSLKSALPKDDVEDIEMYVNVGEWRLAVETLCGMLYQHKSPIKKDDHQLILELINSCDIDMDLGHILEDQTI